MELKITRDLYFILKKEVKNKFKFTYEHTRNEFGQFNGCNYYVKFN